MKKLTSPAMVKEIINRYKFRFSKSLGQNFLIDENILCSIVEGAEIGPDDVVLEVGPGIGTMTQYMATQAKKVVAIEIDNALLPILEETVGIYDNVKVIHGDVLNVDLKRIIDEEFGGQRPKVVANLPYYVTTPIIMRFLEENIPVSDIVVMIQKEVAERMQSGPSTKAYGALSVAVQFYCDPSIITKVPPTVFIPQPKVESSVIRLKALMEPRVEVSDRKLFFRTVKAAFAKRRKTLLNTMSSSFGELSKDEMREILESSGIDPKRRGETLSIQEFAELSEMIGKKIKK